MSEQVEQSAHHCPSPLSPTHQGQGLPTSHGALHIHRTATTTPPHTHMQGTATRTGYCCKSWEVLGCEQRCRQLPEEPLEQVGCVIGMNLVPAHEASIEASLQLLLQSLEKGRPPRSCPQLPCKLLTLSGLQCLFASLGQPWHLPNMVTMSIRCHFESSY